MFKLISKLFLSLIFSLLIAGQVFAGTNVTSVRFEQPKTPTNQNNFNLIFVTLDTDATKTVDVVCKKKGPSEGGFTQFASTTTTSGGNTGNCQVNSSIVNTEGTYTFRVEATGSSFASDEVSVEYKTTGPGTPTFYSKEKILSCTYRIKFKTADDSGKTVQVRLYRSDATAFDASSANQVDSILIGSNSEGQFENTVPDCNKEYFYGVRAFDSAGNGSGVIGDTVSITTTTTTTTAGIAPTGTTGGAIPVGEGQGQVLGEETKTGEVKGEATPSAGPTGGEEQKEAEKPAEKGGIFSIKNVLSGAIILAIVSFLYFWYRRSRNSI